MLIFFYSGEVQKLDFLLDTAFDNELIADKAVYVAYDFIIAQCKRKFF